MRLISRFGRFCFLGVFVFLSLYFCAQKACLDFVGGDARRLPQIMDTDSFQMLDKALLHEMMAAMGPPCAKKRKSGVRCCVFCDMQVTCFLYRL